METMVSKIWCIEVETETAEERRKRHTVIPKHMLPLKIPFTSASRRPLRGGDGWRGPTPNVFLYVRYRSQPSIKMPSYTAPILPHDGVVRTYLNMFVTFARIVLERPLLSPLSYRYVDFDRLSKN